MHDLYRYNERHSSHLPLSGQYVIASPDKLKTQLIGMTVRIVFPMRKVGKIIEARKESPATTLMYGE